MAAMASVLPLNFTFGDGIVPSNAVYQSLGRGSTDDCVKDLLSYMAVVEKVGQAIQGGIFCWLNTTDRSFNFSGLVDSMNYKSW